MHRSHLTRQSDALFHAQKLFPKKLFKTLAFRFFCCIIKMQPRDEANIRGRGEKKMSSNLKTNVTVVRESAKGAFLVQNESGQSCWVQPRSLKDGQVNASLFDRRAAEQAEREADRAVVKEFSDGFHSVRVSWENEKCIGLDGVAESATTGLTRRVRVFVPKSVLKGGRAPGWILSRKLYEALENMEEDLRGMCWICTIIGGVEVVA